MHALRRTAPRLPLLRTLTASRLSPLASFPFHSSAVSRDESSAAETGTLSDRLRERRAPPASLPSSNAAPSSSPSSSTDTVETRPKTTSGRRKKRRYKAKKTSATIPSEGYVQKELAWDDQLKELQAVQKERRRTEKNMIRLQQKQKEMLVERRKRKKERAKEAAGGEKSEQGEQEASAARSTGEGADPPRDKKSKIERAERAMNAKVEAALNFPAHSAEEKKAVKEAFSQLKEARQMTRAWDKLTFAHRQEEAQRVKHEMQQELKWREEQKKALDSSNSPSSSPDSSEANKESHPLLAAFYSNSPPPSDSPAFDYVLGSSSQLPGVPSHPLPREFKDLPGDFQKALRQTDKIAFSVAKGRWPVRKEQFRTQRNATISHLGRLLTPLERVRKQSLAAAQPPKGSKETGADGDALLESIAKTLDVSKLDKKESRLPPSTSEGKGRKIRIARKEEEKSKAAARPDGPLAPSSDAPRPRSQPPTASSSSSRIADHPALRNQPSSSDSPSPFSPPRSLSSYPLTLSPSSVPFTPHPSPLGPVPIAKLAHSLDRVLFNPGVHFLRDPRTGVYNFDPTTLESVPKVEEFEFAKLPQYVTSSKDEVLKGIVEDEGRTFAGSTSSTVGMLCQIYFWLSKNKPLNTSMLSADFRDLSTEFSMGQRLPVSVVLHHRDGKYAIDADKSFDSTSNSANILADYGHLMEKLLTTDAKEFQRFLVDAEDPAPSEADQKQAYHYAMTDHLVLRSQLDAHNEHLPHKTFDLKTRGTVAIRQDRLNYEESAGYTIDKLRGRWESFEREYYDLIRSAFLKYSLQARIGHMDGILVAYHSTARFYGFQYIPISEMDEALHGNSATGQQAFKLSLGLLEKLLLEASKCYPGESVNVTWAADPDKDVLRVFVAPQKDVEAAQEAARTAKDEDKEEPTGEEQNGADPAPNPSVEQLEKVPMTLLEVRGTNYLDGEAQPGPVTLYPRRRDALSSNLDEPYVPTWQLGYDITKSTGNDLDPSNSEPVSAHRIAQLFAETREFQKMFSSIALPSGVTLEDVVAATERAKEVGVELDPSDLSVRFPLGEGIEYTDVLSRNVRNLRRIARHGAARRTAEEQRRAEEGDGVEKRVQIVSRVEVVEQ
ncbi:hypothetical protein JCM8547_000346 [Rhodosporidiobolus lusitaniae]